MTNTIVVPEKSHLWTKGQSGNPAGRPKGTALGKLKQWSIDNVQRFITETELMLASDISPELRWKIITFIFERAEGRVANQIDVKTISSHPSEMTGKELAEELNSRKIEWCQNVLTSVVESEEREHIDG